MTAPVRRAKFNITHSPIVKVSRLPVGTKEELGALSCRRDESGAIVERYRGVVGLNRREEPFKPIARKRVSGHIGIEAIWRYLATPDVEKSVPVSAGVDPEKCVLVRTNGCIVRNRSQGRHALPWPVKTWGGEHSA